MEYNQRGEIKELPKLVFSMTKSKISKDLFINIEVRLSSGQQSVKFFQLVDENENGNVFAPIPTSGCSYSWK